MICKCGKAIGDPASHRGEANGSAWMPSIALVTLIAVVIVIVVL